MARSKFEKKCQKELEAEGWLVDWKIRPSGFKNPRGYAVDYFSLFDILAHKDGVLRWIFIKGTRGILNSEREDVRNFKLPKGCIKEMWFYRKLKGHGNKFIPHKEIMD